MQGYVRVSPADSKIAIKWNSPSFHEAQEGEHAEREEHGTR